MPEACRSAAIAVVLLGLACKPAQAPPPPPPPAAAVVNGAPIPVSRPQVELDRVRRGEDGVAKVESQDLPHLAHALLDRLIDPTIVLQPAQSARPFVSGAE